MPLKRGASSSGSLRSESEASDDSSSYVKVERGDAVEAHGAEAADVHVVMGEEGGEAAAAGAEDGVSAAQAADVHVVMGEEGGEAAAAGAEDGVSAAQVADVHVVMGEEGGEAAAAGAEDGGSAAQAAQAAQAAREEGAQPGEGEAAAAADAEEAKARAAEAKARGNEHFKRREYREALECYAEACASDPDEAAYLGNKSAAEFMLRRYREAVASCDGALARRADFHKAAVRRCKARCALGELAMAESELAKHAAVYPGEAAVVAELEGVRGVVAELAKAEDALAHNDAPSARVAALKVRAAVETPAVLLLLARCELGCGRAEQASKVCLDLIRADRQYVPAYSLRGQALAALGDLAQAEAHLKQALQFDPDHTESAKSLKRARSIKRGFEAVKGHVFKREFDDAAEQLTELLANPLVVSSKDMKARIYGERANCYQRGKRFPECLKDCAQAIYANPRHKEAFLTRSNALQALGRHEEAVADLETVASKLDPEDKLVRQRLQRAQFELRKSKRPDYYGILGAKTVASMPEIKAAYKKRALEWHPDRWSTKGEEAKAEAERKFKMIGDALEMLSDPRKKQLWDEGYDEEQIKEMMAREQFSGGCCGGGC